MNPKIFIVLPFLYLGLAAPSALGQNPLEPLDFLTGGVWIGEFTLPSGETIRQERTYRWALDRMLIIGKTIRITEDTRKQTRQVVFTWNADRQIIEFWDFIDTGGYGRGFVKATGRDTLYMEAEIVVSDHIDWRADFINKKGKTFVSKVQVPQNGKWVDAGTFLFQRKTSINDRQD